MRSLMIRPLQIAAAVRLCSICRPRLALWELECGGLGSGNSACGRHRLELRVARFSGSGDGS
ncbi:hypothetical protein Mapa_001324 [Marchantia paleacea]|nr:hypothetical protein Mapa_001324 [Marchantia paleacea]